MKLVQDNTLVLAWLLKSEVAVSFQSFFACAIGTRNLRPSTLDVCWSPRSSKNNASWVLECHTSPNSLKSYTPTTEVLNSGLTPKFATPEKNL